MFVNDDSIISYREIKDKSNNEEKEESYYKVKSKEIKDSEIESENVVYINVRWSLCSELPRPITRNRTPPPHSQPNKNLTLNKTIFDNDEHYP